MNASSTSPNSKPRGASRDLALVAPKLRRSAWWVVACSSLLVALGGIIAHGDRAPLAIEIRVQDAVDARFGNTEMWKHAFGTGIPRTGLIVFLLLITWTLTRRWWRGMAACAAVPIAVATSEHVLKPLVDRMDTGNPELFYPSGHLTGVGAITALVVVLVAPSFARVGVRWSIVGACAVAMGVALLATVAGHGHGPLDALAGLPTGVAITLAWVLLVDTGFDCAAPNTSVPRGRARRRETRPGDTSLP